jgi:hypothetical protein
LISSFADNKKEGKVALSNEILYLGRTIENYDVVSGSFRNSSLPIAAETLHIFKPFLTKPETVVQETKL